MAAIGTPVKTVWAPKPEPAPFFAPPIKVPETVPQKEPVEVGK